jgi:hypothetical protein
MKPARIEVLARYEFVVGRTVLEEFRPLVRDRGLDLGRVDALLDVGFERELAGERKRLHATDTSSTSLSL